MLKQRLVDRLRELETHSTCQRRHVACIFVSDSGEVVAEAYNANSPYPTCERPAEQGNCGCIHAEVRALANFSGGGVCSVWISAAPCAPCAKVLTLVKPTVVFYLEESHPMLEGFAVLDAAGILHVKVSQ